MRIASLLIALLSLALPLQAQEVRAHWARPDLPQTLRAQLLQDQIWRKAPVSLDYFLPKPEHQLILRSACTKDRDTAFYRELQDRGAPRKSGSTCPDILTWTEEKETNFVFTFAELQKKYLPIDNLAEAASFFMASGIYVRGELYAAKLAENYYIMTVEPFCRGVAATRKIYQMSDKSPPQLLGTIDEPPPRGYGCPSEGN